MGVLAHELVHIWQQGGNLFTYITWFIRIAFGETIPNEINGPAGLGTSYDIDATDLGKNWDDLSFEQQAEIMRYYAEGVIMGKKQIHVGGLGWVSVNPADANWTAILALAAQFLGLPSQQG